MHNVYVCCVSSSNTTTRNKGSRQGEAALAFTKDRRHGSPESMAAGRADSSATIQTHCFMSCSCREGVEHVQANGQVACPHG